MALSLGGFAAIAATRMPFNERLCDPLAAALILGVLGLETGHGVSKLLLPAFVGDASYSIYLWHSFAISVAAKAVIFFSVPKPLTFNAAVMAGTACGSTAYLWTEEPLLRMRGRPIVQLPRRA